MAGSQLNQIRYLLPADGASRAWFAALAPLLGEAPQARLAGDRLAIVPDYPDGAIPATTLELARVDRPTVVLDTIGLVAIEMGGIRLLGWDARDPVALPPPAPVTPDHPPLDPAEIAACLRGHIVRVDHTGVELPAARVPRFAWERLLDTLGAAANLYSYPEPDTEMPFVVPGNRNEFGGDIVSFGAPRVPKFELTYGLVPAPLLQFHCAADLARAALDACLPAPSGYNLPGVDTFRSVYVAAPWAGVTVRLDLSYADAGDHDDWDSGAWLVQDGQRLRSRR